MRNIVTVIACLIASLPLAFTLYVVYISLTGDIKKNDLKALAKVVIGVAFVSFYVWMVTLMLSPSKGGSTEVDDTNQWDLTR